MRLILLIIASWMCYVPWVHAQQKPAAEFKSDVTSTNTPWTHTDFKNDPDNFQFAIVSDRTNGHRAGIFRSAVTKLNMLQPEFVLSIGDFIEGYTTDSLKLREQWGEFNGLLKPLTMPFFRVPGNHDLSNDVQRKMWKEQFGREYYNFTYKNVLFIVLNSSDGDGLPFTPEQIKYVKNVIQDQPRPRWTFLLMHHPVWNKRESNGFGEIEAALGNRPYTVIAGHTHKYLYAEHNQRDYFILGTTGGSSGLRGAAFGEMDHISWVTMTENGPKLSNILLDGILRHDVSNERTRALASNLSLISVRKPFILSPVNGTGKNSKIFFNILNKSDLPLNFEGTFRHRNGVQLSEEIFTAHAAANDILRKSIEVSMQNADGSSTRDTLELDWKLSYSGSDQDLPSLKGLLKIPLKASVPFILDLSVPVFTSSKEVAISNPYPGTQVRYTIDGKEPDVNSPVYKAPFTLQETANVKVRVFSADGTSASGVQSFEFKKVKFQEAAKPAKKLTKGLHYNYYEGSYKKLPDFGKLSPLRNGVTTDLNIDKIKLDRQNQFALLITGYVTIGDDDLYKFYLTSDDGCKVYIDDQLVVDNDGSHSVREKSGFIALKKGLHKIKFEYFEDFDGELIQLDYERKGGSGKRQVPLDNYSH